MFRAEVNEVPKGSAVKVPLGLLGEAEWQALQSRLAQQEAAQPPVLQGVPRGAA